MLLALLVVLAASMPAASTAEGWPDHGGPAGGSRHSPLTQITPDNVGDLEVAWTYRTGDGVGPMRTGGSYGLVVTPILLPPEAGGTLVLCSPFSRVIALEPATGREVWSYDPRVSRGETDVQYKCHGVSQWHDSVAPDSAACAWRILLTTVDQRLITLDARTGTPCAGFGDAGVVNLAPYIAATVPATDTAGVRHYMPPAILRDTIVVGTSVGAKFRMANAPSGAVRAFDARTGEPRWTFDPVPRDPAEARKLGWTAEAAALTGGANVWSLMSVDEARNLIFLPTSSPSPNYFGGTRPGDNRYGNSLVALDGATGQVRWHQQLVHHDVWDWDLPAQPLLVDIRRDGALVPAVVQLTKQGFVFVFHRETGLPLFPIEEVPVPTDGVPGEVLSPTQPVPVAPPPLVRQGITPDDAWGFTVFDRAACRRVIERYRHGGLFTPPSTRGTILRPGMVSNWGSGAFDPRRNLLITNAQDMASLVRLVPVAQMAAGDARSPMAGLPGGPPGPIEGTPYAVERGVMQLFSPLNAPCTKPPWYSLVAVDLERGDIAWSVPLGTIDKLLHLPLDLPFGAPGIGGPIVTGSGLVFIGATADERFRAFDIATGKELWRAELPTSAMSTPMTYESRGRQFVVIAAGGHHAYYRQKLGDTVVAFALPKRGRIP